MPEIVPAPPFQPCFRPLKCRITVGDELALWLYLKTSTPWPLIVNLLVALLIAAALAACSVPVLLSGLLACGFNLWVEGVLLSRLLIRRWGPSKDRYSTFLLQMAAEGTIVTNGVARVEQRWGAFKALHVARERLYLFLGKGTAYVIPRRLFSDDDEWQSFVTAVREGFDRGKAEIP